MASYFSSSWLCYRYFVLTPKWRLHLALLLMVDPRTVVSLWLSHHVHCNESHISYNGSCLIKSPGPGALIFKKRWLPFGDFWWRDSPSLSKSALSSERQSQAWQKQKGYLPEQWNTQLSTFTVCNNQRRDNTPTTSPVPRLPHFSATIQIDTEREFWTG